MTVVDRRWRAVLTLVLAIYGYLCLRSPGDHRWLDSLDLAIHETGHLVFAFDGETLAVLGGGEHDWTFLLSEWGWLTRDGALADTVHLVGVVLYLVALAGGWYLLRHEPGPGTSSEEKGTALAADERR